MKWSRKGDLALGYGGIVAGIMISGFFFKIAMMVDDPYKIFEIKTVYSNTFVIK